MSRVLALVTFAVMIPAVAVAGPAKPKAHIECMSGEPVKSGKAARLTGELWCSIRIDKLGGFKPEGLVATMSIQPGKNTTLKTMPGGVELKIADTQDGIEARLDNAWVVETDYKTCEPFTINAALHDEANRGIDDEVWEASFKVNASCPKPKPVKGLLRCHYSAQDGTLFKWPGNGAKVKPRMETTLSCGITAPKIETGVPYEVSIAIEKKGKPATGRFERDQAFIPFFDAEFEQDVYEPCSNFTVLGEVKANGVKLWSGKLPIKQDCPD